MNYLINTECSIDVMQQYKEKDVRYALLKIRFRKTVRFVIYAENRDESAMESVEMDEARINGCFSQLVKGRLAPCHLRDWICDEIAAAYV